MELSMELIRENSKDELISDEMDKARAFSFIVDVPDDLLPKNCTS